MIIEGRTTVSNFLAGQIVRTTFTVFTDRLKRAFC